MEERQLETYGEKGKSKDKGGLRSERKRGEGLRENRYPSQNLDSLDTHTHKRRNRNILKKDEIEQDCENAKFDYFQRKKKSE